MPPRGTEARAEQLSTLGRIAHERFTDDEVGRLLDRGRAARRVAAVRLRRPEPRPRDPARLGEGAPRADRAPRRDDAPGRPRPPRLGRGAPDERLRLVPPVPADERRAQAALRRVLRVVGQPVHAAPRRLRARDADDRGARGVRRAAPRAHRARRAPRPRSTRRSSTATSRPTRSARSPSAVLRTMGFDDGAWRLDPTAHPFCTSFSNRDVRLTTRYQPGRPRVGLVDDARGGARALRPRDRRRAAPLAARTARRRSGSTSRRAAPGRTSSGAAGRSGSTGTGRCRSVPRAPRRRARRRSSARSTAPSPG